MSTKEYVILVNENDQPLGLEEKMKAHEEGLLHRAFSIFLWNDKGQMLLQQRALEKYHCGGLWTNACCSHPREGELTGAAATRRLREELGIEVPLQKAFEFTYRADMGNGLVEHEFDHVWTGTYSGAVPFDPAEVKDIRYLSMEEIQVWLQERPQEFTPWFRIAWPLIQDWKRASKNKEDKS